MSVWDTYVMKTKIILANSWIQKTKKGYGGNRFDAFLQFFWEGVGYIIFCFFGCGCILVNKLFFLTKNRKWVYIRCHGLIFFPEGLIFRAGSDLSVNKIPRPQFFTKNDFFKGAIFRQFSNVF